MSMSVDRKPGFEIPYIINGKSGSRLRNPKILDYRGDEVYVFSRQAFLDHRDRLIRITAGFMSSELGWSSEAALSTIEKGLEVTEEDLANEMRIPSVLLFKRGQGYIGVSAQRCIDIYTRQAGNIPSLQHLLRAFKEPHRGKHRGRFAVQQAQIIHSDAMVYLHRSQSAVPMYANLQSGIFEQGEYYPLEKLFDTDPLIQEIMVGYFMRARVNGRSVDWFTGVSKDDFPEPNKSYLPNINHAPTMELFRRLNEEFGMELPEHGSNKPPSRHSMNLVGKLR